MNRLSHLFTLGAAIAGLTVVGCASTGRPESLSEAKAGLDHDSANELTLLRPALVKEAREAAAAGEKDFQRGHLDDAELHGYVALARLKTADHLVAAEAAKAKATAMKAAGITAHADALERKRFAEMGQKIDSLTTELRAEGGADPMQQQASLAVAQARRAQAAAIGNGKSATTAYAQGRLRLEQAVQSLDLGLFAESRAAADEAAMLFVSVGATPGEARVATAAASTDKAPSSLERRLSGVMADARSARSRARSVGGDAAFMEEGATHLTLALESQVDGDLDTALREARVSLARFEDAAARSPTSPTTSATPATSTPSNAQWTALGLARADAIGAGLPAQCGAAFDEFEAVYALAKEQRAAGANDATVLMVRAEERLHQCQSMGRSGTSAKTSSTTSQAAPAKLADDSAARASLAKAQLAISAARVSNVDPARITEARTLVGQAEAWLTRGAPGEAKVLADGVPPLLATTPATTKATTTTTTPADSRACRSARSLLEQKRAIKGDSAFSELEDLITQLKCAEAVTRLVVAGEDVQLASPTAVTAAPVDDRLWRPAYQSILDARVARARLDGVATAEDSAAIARAERFFAQARDAWQRQDYLAAERYARAATADYRAIAQMAAERRVMTDADADAARARAAADRVAADKAADRADAADKASADKAAADKAAADKAAADKAAMGANAADKAAADKAAADKAAADKAAADKAAADKAAGDKAAAADKAAADKAAAADKRVLQDDSQLALRRLDVALVMCAKEACEKRDLEKLATAKRLQTDATAAFDEGRYERATTLATEGVGLVEKTRGTAIDDAPIQAELHKKRADDAVARCAADDCAKRDPKRLADVTAKAAEMGVLLKGSKYADVQRIAKEIVTTVDEIRATRLPFAIPSTVRSVTRQNDRLVLEPRVNFRAGGVEIVAASLPSVADLSQVLQANAARIKTVTLIGHTDSGGNEDKNRQLSKDRAAALKTALVERGVKADIITTDGRGEDEPIADNATSAGRDANRRVDIIITEQ